MIREAIILELARRSRLGQKPSNAYQLAHALEWHPQSVYRMLGDTRPGFHTTQAERMMSALGLCIVRKDGK